MADYKNGKQSPVESCSLTLRPDVGGKYTCEAANIKDACTIKVLQLKVVVSRDLLKWVIIIITIIIIIIILSL